MTMNKKEGSLGMCGTMEVKEADGQPVPYAVDYPRMWKEAAGVISGASSVVSDSAGIHRKGQKTGENLILS